MAVDGFNERERFTGQRDWETARLIAFFTVAIWQDKKAKKYKQPRDLFRFDWEEPEADYQAKVRDEMMKRREELAPVLEMLRNARERGVVEEVDMTSMSKLKKIIGDYAEARH